VGLVYVPFDGIQKQLARSFSHFDGIEGIVQVLLLTEGVGSRWLDRVIAGLLSLFDHRVAAWAALSEEVGSRRASKE
jgi:hypothetical protein